MFLGSAKRVGYGQLFLGSLHHVFHWVRIRVTAGELLFLGSTRNYPFLNQRQVNYLLFVRSTHLTHTWLRIRVKAIEVLFLVSTTYLFLAVG